MKFTLSEDRRQEGVVQFHDYYETGPEQGVKDLKRADSSKLQLNTSVRNGAGTWRSRLWELYQHSLPAICKAKAYECGIPAIECECKL